MEEERYSGVGVIVRVICPFIFISSWKSSSLSSWISGVQRTCRIGKMSTMRMEYENVSFFCL